MGVNHGVTGRRLIAYMLKYMLNKAMICFLFLVAYTTGFLEKSRVIIRLNHRSPLMLASVTELG